jgi:hypothetical protein
VPTGAIDRLHKAVEKRAVDEIKHANVDQIDQMGVQNFLATQAEE